MANILEKTIEFISPSWAAARQGARDEMEISKEILATYKGATHGRNDQGWTLATGSPIVANGDLSLGNLAQLRARSRSLCQNNAIASGLLNLSVANIVGDKGFGLHCMTDTPSWNKQCEGLWNDWTDTADILGNTWLEHIRNAVLHWKRDGDFGSIMGIDGRLQAIDPSRIETPFSKAGQPYCVDGVQTDRAGRPLAYFITDYDGYTRLPDPTVVDARYFAFIRRSKGVSQTRGEPILATSLQVFDQIDQWQFSTLLTARMQSMLAWAITKENAAQTIKAAGRGKPPIPPADGKSNAGAPRQVKLENGTFITLNPGEDIKTIASSHPSAQFPENFKLALRTVGLEFAFPLELVLMDYTGVSGPTARAAMLPMQKETKTQQNIFIAKYLSPIFKWKVENWISQGKLPKNPQSSNFCFIPTRFEAVDPVAELQALMMEIDAGLSTHKRQLLERGIEYDSWKDQRQTEIEAEKEASIPQLHSTQAQEFTNQPSDKKGEGETIPQAEGDKNGN